MDTVKVRHGTSPVILSIPHSATWLPDDIAVRLSDHGRRLIDTDWHVDILYGGLMPEATTVTAGFHRYLIDANRPPGDESLYPGQASTGLVPLTDFDGRAIWCDGEAPDADEIAERVARYHTPYHAALAEEIARVRDMHGIAILYDCHSIRSKVPRLFEGTLPDLNIGTHDGRTCAPEIEDLIVEHAKLDPSYNVILNGRFKGGWTVRHHGRPEDGVHAVQMELAQSTYLAVEDAPWRYDCDKAAKLRPVLQDILEALDQAGLARAADGVGA
ncbi:MAG: N-formylglutamate deformylase [Pseudomonadota bacterium]